jgi:L-alanine-DL-glutamate epimerase-like enolase superfamily enzyme
MIKARVAYSELKFRRPASTSRGTYNSKKVFFIILYHTDDPTIAGIGECTLFPRLSYDDVKGFEARIHKTVERINQGEYGADPSLSEWPSISFALETAWKDIRVKGSKIMYPSDFTEGKDSITINGLIWMDSKEDMLRQIKLKLNEGFSCLKLKVGALSLDDELDILTKLRKEFSPEELEIRVDANGAFRIKEAPEILKLLSDFELHSIEQPIATGHLEALASICRSSPLPVALDEELIGKHTGQARRKLLDIVKPHYLVLKPGLLGGITACKEWIDLAKDRRIDWWITSSLETNIGLNVIAQWTYTLNNPMAQGLSTGSLYNGNIPSPLYLFGEKLYYDPDKKWDLAAFNDVQPS